MRVLSMNIILVNQRADFKIPHLSPQPDGCTGGSPCVARSRVVRLERRPRAIATAILQEIEYDL